MARVGARKGAAELIWDRQRRDVVDVDVQAWHVENVRQSLDRDHSCVGSWFDFDGVDAWGRGLLSLRPCE